MTHVGVGISEPLHSHRRVRFRTHCPGISFMMKKEAWTKEKLMALLVDKRVIGGFGVAGSV